MKVALATLKTLGFEDLLGNSSLLTTFLLIDLEGKTPMEGYTAWVVGYRKRTFKSNR